MSYRYEDHRSSELRRAILNRDKEACSKFAKKGSNSEKNKKKRRLLKFLEECFERDIQANLHICPVD